MTVSTLTGYLIGPGGAIVEITTDDPPPPTWSIAKPKPITPQPMRKMSLKDAMDRVGKHVSTPLETWVYHRVRGIKSLVYVLDEEQAWSLIDPEKRS